MINSVNFQSSYLVVILFFFNWWTGDLFKYFKIWERFQVADLCLSFPLTLQVTILQYFQFSLPYELGRGVIWYVCSQLDVEIFQKYFMNKTTSTLPQLNDEYRPG